MKNKELLARRKYFSKINNISHAFADTGVELQIWNHLITVTCKYTTNSHEFFSWSSLYVSPRKIFIFLIFLMLQTRMLRAIIFYLFLLKNIINPSNIETNLDHLQLASENRICYLFFFCCNTWARTNELAFILIWNFGSLPEEIGSISNIKQPLYTFLLPSSFLILLIFLVQKKFY